MLFKVRQYEKDFIFLLDFQAMVSSQLYARYYFELRELFGQLQRGSENLHVSFPMKPLELWRARKLQLVSASFKMQKSGRGVSTSASPLNRNHKGIRDSPWAMNRGVGDESPGSDSSDHPTQAMDDNDITYTPRGRYVQS